MAYLSDIFLIDYGNGFDLNKMKISNESNKINFVSRTSKNNGVSAYVEKYKHIEPYSPELITVALGGSVLTSCVQLDEFYTGQNVAILIPKQDMTLQEKLFYCYCIKMNKYKYSACGREANSTLKYLVVPDLDDIPKWVNLIEIRDLSDYKSKFIDIDSPDLNIDKWKPFKVKDLFDTIEQCKCGNAGELIDGDDIWYIGAKKRDNGLMRKVKLEDKLVSKGNGIIMIGTGEGSVGYTNYIDKDFIGHKNISIGYSREIDKYTGIFMVTMFNINKFKYNYGRGWNGTRLTESEILLPVILDKDGLPKLNKDLTYTPDYEFMRNYIKTVAYSKYL